MFEAALVIMEMMAEQGKRKGGVVNRVADERWFWAASSIGQLGWGILAFRRGYAGDSRFMPLKSFAIASLFVGAAASVTVGSLRASGIYSVEDCKSLGANIRTGLGLHRRTPKE